MLDLKRLCYSNEGVQYLKRHYNPKHSSKMDNFQQQLGIDKIESLENVLKNQQISLRRHYVESVSNVKISYIIQHRETRFPVEKS